MLINVSEVVAPQLARMTFHPAPVPPRPHREMSVTRLCLDFFFTPLPPG